MHSSFIIHRSLINWSGLRHRVCRNVLSITRLEGAGAGLAPARAAAPLLDELGSCITGAAVTGAAVTGAGAGFGLSQSVHLSGMLCSELTRRD